MGYAGGTKENPTYHSLGDHTETLQIDFDPAKTHYGKLLEIFWGEHEPWSRPWSRQYMSVIFYHSEEQKKAALASREREASRLGARIYTEIMPFTRFHLAEGYHQKYYLRNRGEVARELRAIYPAEKDFIDSTAAARLNGYAGGYGTGGDFEKEAADLGLSPEGIARMKEILRRRM